MRNFKAFAVIFIVSTHVASAIVVNHGSLEARLSETRSHVEAETFPAVCTVVYGGNVLFTGTLISKQGPWGFVLTQGFGLDHANEDDVFISFGSSYKDSASGFVPVEEIHYNPGLRGDSIAILRFRLANLKTVIEPVPFDESAENIYRSGAFYEGTMVGFGEFGSNRSNLFEEATGRVHLAMTWVRFENGRFTIALPHLANYEDIPLFPHMFAMSFPAFVKVPFWSIRAHNRQGFLTPGDMGSPLILPANPGQRFVVVGVANDYRVGEIQFGDKKLFVSGQTWIGVSQFTPWILRVLRDCEGLLDPGPSRVEKMRKFVDQLLRRSQVFDFMPVPKIDPNHLGFDERKYFDLFKALPLESILRNNRTFCHRLAQEAFDTFKDQFGSSRAGLESLQKIVIALGSIAGEEQRKDLISQAIDGVGDGQEYWVY